MSTNDEHDKHSSDLEDTEWFLHRWRCPWCMSPNLPLYLHDRCNPLDYWCECLCTVHQLVILEEDEPFR